MVIARSWKIKKALSGTPTPGHYELCSEELGNLGEGEIITMMQSEPIKLKNTKDLDVFY